MGDLPNAVVNITYGKSNETRSSCTVQVGRWAAGAKIYAKIRIVIFIYVCLSPAGASCNHGSLGFYQVAGRCIYVHTSSRKSWFDARAICRQKGGDLAVVASETTLTAVDDLLSNTLATSELFWIGLVGRQWMWADGV